MESVIRKNASGGKGEISVKYILNEEEMNGREDVLGSDHCVFLIFGYREHVGKHETYYIMR